MIFTNSRFEEKGKRIFFSGRLQVFELNKLFKHLKQFFGLNCSLARKPIGPGTRNARHSYKHRLIIQDTDFSNEENTSEYVPSSRGSTLESKLEYRNNLLKTPGEYKIRQNKRKLVSKLWSPFLN